ncbi:hypothetical protein FA95DRAFT_610115 [Auriscalpium vulgare]|uniref:Uncharacterized protein n=1 Tax=Auriscalpium vulgare TaxID=40419 RepID=A0ACB8RE40_9AGAM|nr:hypothetical protein FA95DRAFT_610115 [Auriscalpium vulgare]
MARAMPGVAKQHGKVHRTHRSQLPPLEASASTMSAHWRTTARTHWPTLEAVAASPEALSTVPAQQHPENPEQFTCTPVLTTTILSAEWPHGRNNGETMLDNTEKDAATGQERMPPHSENGFLPAQNITGGAPETLEDATAVFEATMDVFVKAVNSFRYDPMASFHRTATAHVQASRSRTSPDFADQRLARSTHRPLENGPIRARQYALGPSRDSHHLEQARPHDDAEQLVDAPSRDGGNPAEQQIPRPEGLRWKPGGKLNIQVAMGLDSSAASRHMYRHIVHSVHELATKAQINFSQTFREQEYDRLAKFYSVMRNKHDILWKYEDDWATKFLLQRYMGRRRYSNSKKPTTEESLLGKGTAPATAARTDKGKDNAANAKQSFSSDDDSKKDDEEQLADTEYDIWLGF